ncbi:O-antigen ligase domain-containing protein [Pedococcus bigeumensis]|uniref:O-antigen ligase domain-containing protein n=1 Tax=Pedococcus bigeumensis TaxID=433644 RepID=A0A502CKT5_9MICO|nr:O-antigen ligase domain-containing protein [Pedococcus bigeumensis]
MPARLAAPRADGTTFITIYLVLLFAIPSRLVVGPLGTIGAPATVVGLTGTGWWLWHQAAQPFGHPLSFQPVRRMSVVFFGAVMLSYIAAVSRPISATESSSAQSGVLLLLSWLGILLVTHDGLPNRERLDTLLRRLALAVGLMAALGVLQFATGRPFTNYIQIPGLEATSSLVSVNERGGFARPAGTAIHPIEFGAVINLMLPLCLHVALHPGPLGRFRRWFPVAAIALSIPLSISRSALVSAAIVLAFLVPTWERRLRRIALVAMSLLGGVVFVAVPGMLGTILGLFSGISGDSSTQSRTGSYGLAWEFIQRSPLIGRGFLTFLPEYRILDNQYLGLLIDCGVVGLVTLLALFGTGIVVSLICRRRSTDPATRSLGQSLAAATASATASFALFDAFSFPMFAGATFLILGITGCLFNLERIQKALPPKGAARERPGVAVASMPSVAAASIGHPGETG